MERHVCQLLIQGWKFLNKTVRTIIATIIANKTGTMQTSEILRMKHKLPMFDCQDNQVKFVPGGSFTMG